MAQSPEQLDKHCSPGLRRDIKRQTARKARRAARRAIRAGEETARRRFLKGWAS